MNRLIASIIIALAASAAAMAQTHYVPHVWVGGQAGVTLSEITFAPSVREKMNQGVTAGVAFRFAEERHVGLQVELNATQRGWKEDFEGAPLSYSRTLTYIDLPVMTHIFFGPRKLKFIFNLGADVSYMIADNIKANFDYRNVAAVEGFPIDKRAVDQLTLPIKNRMDYGIVGGFGIEYRLNPRNAVALEGRYYFGLGNIFASTRRDPFNASRHSSIAVTAAYRFRLK